MLMHDTCEHCLALEETGECCGEVSCPCRNMYRESKRGEISQSMIVNYFDRKRKGR